MKKLIVAALCFASAACAIRQEVQPLAYNQDQERKVCVVNNPDVREGFLTAYQNALENKGFAVQVLEPRASLNSCSLTSTYSASWQWDLALYMAHAEIKVYQGAAPVAEAIYDSRGGSGNMNKFINANEKVRELVDLLFPWPNLAEKEQ